MYRYRSNAVSEQLKRTSVNIPPEVAKVVDAVYEKYGFKSRDEFIRDAVKRRLEEMNLWPPQRRITHFNVYQDHVTVIDSELKNLWIDLYIRNRQLRCSYCERNNCIHTEFARDIPQVAKVLSE